MLLKGSKRDRDQGVSVSRCLKVKDRVEEPWKHAYLKVISHILFIINYWHDWKLVMFFWYLPYQLMQDFYHLLDPKKAQEVETT